MTTESSTNDAKKAGGYFKEKFGIGITRITGDEVDRALMKVTSHKLKVPNEKHMLRLLDATHGHFNPGSSSYEDVNAYIILELERRTHTHNWIVVIKSLLVFHRLMVDGSSDVCRKIQKCKSLFCPSNVKNLADSPDGAAQQRIILQFMRYLEERSIAQQNIGLAVRIESDEFAAALAAMDHITLKAALDTMLAWIEVIAATEYDGEAVVNNFATLELYNRLIRDGKRLYIIMTERFKVLIEGFSHLSPMAKKDVYSLYKRYNDASLKLQAFFAALASSNIHFGVEVPTIRLAPNSLLASLEEEVLVATVPKENIAAFAPKSEQKKPEQKLEPGNPKQTGATATPQAQQPRSLPPPAAPSKPADTSLFAQQEEKPMQEQPLSLSEVFDPSMRPSAQPQAKASLLPGSFDPFAVAAAAPPKDETPQKKEVLDFFSKASPSPQTKAPLDMQFSPPPPARGSEEKPRAW